MGTPPLVGDSDGRGAEERLRLLSEIVREFSAATDDYDVLLSLVTRRLSETFGDLCDLRLVSADGSFLEFVGAAHHPDPAVLELARASVLDNPQRVGEGISGQVALTGRAVLVPVVDMARVLANLDPQRRRFVERQGFTSLIVAPLLSRGRVIGVVSLSRSDSARPYDASTLAFVEDLAAHAALALANARSYAAEQAARAEAVAANQALHQSRDAHRLLFEASPLPLFVFDIETLSPLAVNERTLELYGYTREEFMRLDASALAVHGQDATRARLAAWQDRESSGTTRYRRKDGTEFLAEFTTRVLAFAGRRARIAVIKDITEREESEQLRALLAAIVDSSNDAIISKRLDGTITSWNGAAERLFGYSAAEAVGQPITLLIPPDRLIEEADIIARVTAGERIEHYETVRLRKGGGDIVVSISVAPILDAAGAVVGASKTVRDLSAQRKVGDALRRTEDQLRQSQKMDAVGRLAGGIAHDFNNLLCVILSYSDMLLSDLSPNDPVRDDLQQINAAAARAADLTRHLLTFSRQQMMEPKLLDLTAILVGLDKILRRILGEDITLSVTPAHGFSRIYADPGNLEQVIMNLVVNARDAMPIGGKLTIETANIDLDESYAREHLGTTVGPHVMLAVSDTGVGMDAATQQRIFEPFFTTKAPGKGTGLGLSTVFGIAQQCGGSVWVYSEPGAGTTFKVYFPRVDAAATAVEVGTDPPTSMRGSETVLLVEDQAQVRGVAEEILERHGYRVLSAEGADAAMLFVERHPGAIHLLLTDVVMPQMSGVELAKRMAALRPDTKVLFMSGYTDDSIVRHGVIESGIAFLQKPFTPESLVRRVRDALSGARRSLG